MALGHKKWVQPSGPPRNIQVLVSRFAEYKYTHLAFKVSRDTLEDSSFVHATIEDAFDTAASAEPKDLDYVKATPMASGRYDALDIAEPVTKTGMPLKIALWQILERYPPLSHQDKSKRVPYRKTGEFYDFTLLLAAKGILDYTATALTAYGIEHLKEVMLAAFLDEGSRLESDSSGDLVINDGFLAQNSFEIKDGFTNAVFFAYYKHFPDGFRCDSFVGAALQAAYLIANGFFEDYPLPENPTIEQISHYVQYHILSKGPKKALEIISYYIPPELHFNALLLEPNLFINYLSTHAAPRCLTRTAIEIINSSRLSDRRVIVDLRREETSDFELLEPISFPGDPVPTAAYPAEEAPSALSGDVVSVSNHAATVLMSDKTAAPDASPQLVFARLDSVDVSGRASVPAYAPKPPRRSMSVSPHRRTTSPIPSVASGLSKAVESSSVLPAADEGGIFTVANPMRNADAGAGRLESASPEGRNRCGCIVM